MHNVSSWVNSIKYTKWLEYFDAVCGNKHDFGGK